MSLEGGVSPNPEGTNPEAASPTRRSGDPDEPGSVRVGAGEHLVAVFDQEEVARVRV